MIRDGRRQEHNVGPTPYTRERGPVPGGVLVTARRAKPAPAPRPVSDFDRNEWKRMKRRTDPEWAQRVRDRENARARERYAARKAA